MATERQIQANRANAAKSTGPRTAEGKRASSQNAVRRNLVSNTVVLPGESKRRFNDLAASLALHFQPCNPAELFLVQTMAAARWRLLRTWGIQTASFKLEMARTAQQADPSCPGDLLATTFRRLADNSRTLALQDRFETTYDRQYNRALAMLLKLRQTRNEPDSEPDSAEDPNVQ